MSIENYPIGTVLYSRNFNESENFAPGCVNHLCLLVDSQTIIESQENINGKKGVIKTSVSEYKSRGYQWGALFPKDKNIGKKAAEFAQTLVGRKYGKYSSARKHLNKNTKRINCVSLVALSYSNAVGTQIKLSIGDDIFRYGQIFTDKLS